MEKSETVIWIVGLTASAALGALLFAIAAIFVAPTLVFGAVAWRMLDTFEEHSERVYELSERNLDAMDEMSRTSASISDDGFDARFDRMKRDFDDAQRDFDKARVDARIDRSSSEAGFRTRATAIEANIDRGFARVGR